MRASGVWGAAEPLLLSVSSEGAESQPSQAPWEIPGEAPGLRVSRKLTHLEALEEESFVSPGRPWLGILLVTQCCAMGRVAPVSRDSLQQILVMTGSERAAAPRKCGGAGDPTAEPPAQTRHLLSFHSTITEAEGFLQISQGAGWTLLCFQRGNTGP